MSTHIISSLNTESAFIIFNWRSYLIKSLCRKLRWQTLPGAFFTHCEPKCNSEMKYILLISIGCLVQESTWCSPLQYDFELLILHNNDMHARFEETSRRSSACKDEDKQNNDCVGGFARTAHVIREARNAALSGEGPSTIYLNAGDTYTGTQWFSVHKSKIVAEFLNLLRPDAMSFGNHEFDLQVEGVLPLIDAVQFPIVAANLDFSKEPELQASNVTKSVVLIVNGQKIGVIGYLTPETVLIASPGNIIFNDEVESIKAESEKLSKEGVEIIIALGHSGIETDLKIAKEVPLVDVVIGGHSNTFLWNGKQPDLEEPYGPYPLVVRQESGKKVCVAQAFAYTKYMGHLNVKFNKGEVFECQGQPLFLNSSVPQDEDVLNILEKYRPEVQKLDQRILGRTRVLLDGSAESCRVKECNFGNLITDAFVAFHASNYSGDSWTDASIALLNGGGIRNSIEPRRNNDAITGGNLLAAIPFSNPVHVLTLSGEDLLKSLEIGARSNGETSRGEFLQMSGIHVVYDLSKPPGSRVVKAKARCSDCSIPLYSPIDQKRDYRIIVNGFITFGGDGHTVFKDAGRELVVEARNDFEIVSWYLSHYSPVLTEESDRIVVIHSSGARVSEYFSLIVIAFLVCIRFY